MPSDANSYPLVNFHFAVNFMMELKDAQFLPSKKPLTGEIAFQSVSGLNVELQTESIKEGGENRFEHVVPVRSKYSDLVLKRAVLRNSKVVEWIRRAIENLEVFPIEVQVQLRNENQDPIVTWDVHHAWPKKWSFSDLNAEQGEVFVETLELNYNHFDINYPN